LSDKVKFSAEQLVSTSQLVQKLAKHLECALDYPLFIQKNHEVKWVLLSLKEYERLAINEGRKKK